jgi:hypothetical protein
MPSRQKHEAFDRYLARKHVLLPDGKYGEVHAFMDRGVRDFGASHREVDIYHREKGLRQWLNGKYNVIGQDRATDWLRAGLGHICLDERESYLYKSYSWPEVFDSAYRSMAQRRWTKARFVPT